MTTTTDTAAEALEQQLARTISLLSLIEGEIDRRRPNGSDDVNWGHVGDAIACVTELTEVCEGLGITITE